MTTLTRRGLMGAAAGATAILAEPAGAFAPGRIMPTVFEENIIFVTPRTTDGKSLKLLTDTGGGLFLFETAAARLGLQTREEKDGEQTFRLARLPEFEPAAWIPGPINGDGTHLPMFPAEGEGAYMARRGWDGMLGQAWFGDRIWTFDYPGKRLLLHDAAPAPAGAAAPLHFQTKDGRRSSHFPRIQAEVDGQTLDLLFDTGAQSPLTPEAIAVMGPGGDLRASSFIRREVFDRWRANHPDWQWIEKGEAGMRMDLIRAANVRVAGLDTGPAWFAARPDKNFTEWMAQWMDKPIDGALGASALHPFRIVADYPAAKAWFVRP